MNTFAIIFCAAAATYFWRGGGALFANRIKIDTPAFDFTRCIAYAIVGALILDLILYPQGLLATTSFTTRAFGSAVGLAVFFALRRNVPAGSWAGVIAILAITLSD